MGILLCYSLCSLLMLLIRCYKHPIFHQMLISIPGMKRSRKELVSCCCVANIVNIKDDLKLAAVFLTVYRKLTFQCLQYIQFGTYYTWHHTMIWICCPYICSKSPLPFTERLPPNSAQWLGMSWVRNLALDIGFHGNQSVIMTTKKGWFLKCHGKSGAHVLFLAPW